MSCLQLRASAIRALRDLSIECDELIAPCLYAAGRAWSEDYGRRVTNAQAFGRDRETASVQTYLCRR
jgi:hypothetical protein